MVFKKVQNKILVHMKTFDQPYIRVLDHLLGAVRKLRKHIGVLSWSEKGNFCLFLVLKRGT